MITNCCYPGWYRWMDHELLHRWTSGIVIDWAIDKLTWHREALPFMSRTTQRDKLSNQLFILQWTTLQTRVYLISTVLAITWFRSFTQIACIQLFCTLSNFSWINQSLSEWPKTYFFICKIGLGRYNNVTIKSNTAYFDEVAHNLVFKYI